ncbi:hypothetical protein SPHFLASMR4Y_01725 [Sphingorhabdus sp. SMR4y]|nr:hypothetical protein SPHFLASMR4Y_01725 [Sphingorhabdus sp. SMR4y]
MFVDEEIEFVKGRLGIIAHTRLIALIVVSSMSGIVTGFHAWLSISNNAPHSTAAPITVPSIALMAHNVLCWMRAVRN